MNKYISSIDPDTLAALEQVNKLSPQHQALFFDERGTFILYERERNVMKLKINDKVALIPLIDLSDILIEAYLKGEM